MYIMYIMYIMYTHTHSYISINIKIYIHTYVDTYTRKYLQTFFAPFWIELWLRQEVVTLPFQQGLVQDELTLEKYKRADDSKASRSAEYGEIFYSNKL